MNVANVGPVAVLLGLLGLAPLTSATSPSGSAPHLQSPDQRLVVKIGLPNSGTVKTPTWSATFHGKSILDASNLSLSLVGEGDLLKSARVLGKHLSQSNRTVPMPFGKSATASDKFREVRFSLETPRKRRFSIVFRCYNDAIAFRYEIPKQAGLRVVKVSDEGTSFRLTENPLTYIQYLENYKTSHEHPVSDVRLSQIKPNNLLDLPLTASYADGTRVAITEAALRQYAGMALMKTDPKSNALTCKLTPREDGTKVVRPLELSTPWRVVLVGDRLGSLLESTTLFALNSPNAMGDFSWVQPGKMTWPWWNGNVVKDGKASPPIFSFEAQKTYIDFCAANGIAFHSTIADNTDTPWYKQTKPGVYPGPDTDVTQVRADLDLPAIRAYAASKKVRLWTWVHQAALRGRVEEAFTAFEKFGWTGMMVDFFDHDDQESVEHAEAILRAAARHHILIHFHGIWKPTGMERTYPNLMNHEASLNLEVFKWDRRVPPSHTLNLVFTRMVAGPMDYHAGGFRALGPDKFSVHFTAPYVMGTRSHQLASYICFDNPNPMVADYPGAYEGQKGFDFVRQVPTYWDETRILRGEVGKLLVTARRKGSVWYIGGMSAGNAKTVQVPLDFLGPGPHVASIWHDGALTGPDPNQLEFGTQPISRSTPLNIKVSEDGGFAIRISSR